MKHNKEWSNSTNIAKTEYDDETLYLIVTFKNGKQYGYKNVPQNIYNEMLVCESVGKYVSAYIVKKYETETLIVHEEIKDPIEDVPKSFTLGKTEEKL